MAYQNKYPIGGTYSEQSRKQFGKRSGYGAVEYGYTHQYGLFLINQGIYRIRHYLGKIHKEKINFYSYIITHTIPQDANRTKFKNIQLAWQALAPEIKQQYNIRARGRHMFGNNLYISEQMKL